ncbi:MAG: hypothetical protein ACRDHE_02650, partial [Ktedonobacterales bacterium]
VWLGELGMVNWRNAQRPRLLRRVLAGEPRDVILRQQYPEGMPLPGILGDLSALTPEEEERLELAIAQLNQTYVNSRHDESLERLCAEYLAGRQELVDLLRQFTDEQLAASIPSVVGEATAGDVFAGRAGHAVEHMSSVEDGLRQAR